MEIAYTIGRTAAYEQYLKESDYPTKLGACELPKTDSNYKIGEDNFYKGGSIWKKKQEALHYLNINVIYSDYSVYGVELKNGWDKDVSKEIQDNSWYHLLVTSKIIKI